MDRIINDGSVQAHIFDDFSIFTLENTIVGQYSSKINKGSNNTIIGTNAGKIGLQLNNSIIIGANTDQELLNANKLISIGEHSITSRYINETINIGYYNGNSNNINIDNLDINYLNDKFLTMFNNMRDTYDDRYVIIYKEPDMKMKEILNKLYLDREDFSFIYS